MYETPNHHIPHLAISRLNSTYSNASTNAANTPQINNPPPIGAGYNYGAAAPVTPAGPSNVINLSNSKDVVIGTMTQYQGAVTIYQYMDATVDSSRVGNGPNLSLNGNSNRNKANPTIANTFGCLQNIPNWILVFTFFLIILGLGLGIGLALYKNAVNKVNDAAHDDDEILFGKIYDNTSIPTLGNGHLVIDRRQWGASNLHIRSAKLKHPIPYVLITHITAASSLPCYTLYKCALKMRTNQDIAISDRRISDIRENFCVGSDGYIYVGRGWDIVNSFNNRSLAVCFLANYDRNNTPTATQLDAVQVLLAYGVATKVISSSYRLIAQNQTVKTTSPGRNVYKEIIKWPRWYRCGFDNYPKCGVELGMEDQWYQYN